MCQDEEPLPPVRPRQHDGAISREPFSVNDFVAGGVVLEDGKWVGTESRAACKRLSDYVHEHIATYFVS